MDHNIELAIDLANGEAGDTFHDRLTAAGVDHDLARFFIADYVVGLLADYAVISKREYGAIIAHSQRVCAEDRPLADRIKDLVAVDDHLTLQIGDLDRRLTRLEAAVERSGASLVDREPPGDAGSPPGDTGRPPGDAGRLPVSPTRRGRPANGDWRA